MQTPSAFHTSPDPAPSKTRAPGEVSSQTLSPDQRAGNAGPRLVRWIQRNSFAPRWLPEPLRHPLLGYLAAVLIQAVTTAVMVLVLSRFPTFAFPGVLINVGVILMALGWGAGPGLFATLIGTFLIYYVVLLPHFSWSLANPPDVIGLALYVVVAVGISLIASQAEVARRQTEERNQLLTEAEAQSRLDAQRLRTVLDVLPSAALIADSQGRLVEINQAAKALWSGDVSLTANIAEYAHYKAWWASTGKPVAPEEWTLTRALNSGEVLLNDEIEIESLDGQRKTILNSAAPIRDEQGAIAGGVVSALDISAVRRLEREVAERAAVLQTTFEAIADGIAVVDRQGRLLQTNRAFRALFGVDQRPEYAALSIQERLELFAIHDEQGQPLPTDVWSPKRLLRGETLPGVDLHVKNLEGRELVVNMSGAPIRDATGQMNGGVEVFRDVTERRSLEHRTREALNALVAMGEALTLGADEGDGQTETGEPPHATARATAHRLAELTHRVVECQRVTISLIEPAADTLEPLVASDFSPEQEADWARRLHGASLVERIGDPALVARLHAGEALRLDLAKLPSSITRTYYGTATILAAPMMIGTRLTGLLSVHHTQAGHEYTDEDVDLARAVARLAALVIERDRVLSEREEARAAALAEREANEQMDAFLSMVSHELKQPLTVMSMSIQLAQRRLGRLAAAPSAPSLHDLEEQIAPIQEELREMAQQAAEYQDGLINDLLDAARIRTGKFAICPDPVNLLSLVRNAVEEQRRLTPERVIRLDLPAAPLPVMADGRRIKQVVTNYLTNALKYSPAMRPVEVGVTLEDTRQGAQARVCVHDQGPGLAPDERQRVFERFYRAPGIEVQSGAGIGLGLGLYICRSIIEQHGGQVGVESTPGQGSVFWFTLPVGYPIESGQ